MTQRCDGILMRCLYCQGIIACTTVPLPIDCTGQYLIRDTVLAWVCAQYGQAYFAGAAVEAL